MTKQMIVGAIYGGLLACLLVIIVDIIAAPGITIDNPDDFTSWIQPCRYYLYLAFVVIGIVFGARRGRHRGA